MVSDVLNEFFFIDNKRASDKGFSQRTNRYKNASVMMAYRHLKDKSSYYTTLEWRCRLYKPLIKELYIWCSLRDSN